MKKFETGKSGLSDREWEDCLQRKMNRLKGEKGTMVGRVLR